MKNERGFTLVEVLVSLVILSIVLMSFIAIFGNTNKLAVRNSEKLVVINLADAYLEKIQIDPKATISPTVFPSTTVALPYTKTYNQALTVNGKNYDILIKVSQNTEDNKLSLYNAIVTVRAVNSKVSSSVEGYLTDDK